MKIKYNLIILIILILVFSNYTYAAQTISFTDIKTNDWYKENISLLVSLGGISGYPDGSFAPNKEITRAEFVKTLISSLGYQNVAKTSDHWASGYISLGESLHIVDKGAFKNLDLPITRYEMAIIISNTLHFNNESVPANIQEYKNLIKDFTKIKDNILSECVLESYVKGIVSGYPDGSFMGDKPLTRAEASSVIIRILNEEFRNIPNLPSNANYEEQVLKLINIERKNAKLSLLVLDHELNKVAKLKSEDMGVNNYFDHTSPNYGSPFDMMKKLGITYSAAAENIAKGYKTPEDVVNGWMNSPGHRKNILNPNYNKMGVGIYFGNSTYWTQLFTN